MDWLSHPLFTTLLVSVGNSMAGALYVDWMAFKSFQSLDDAAQYEWKVAGWRAIQGFVVGVVGGLSAIGVTSFFGGGSI